MTEEVKLFMAILKANHSIEIHTPDINELIREVRQQAGVRLYVQQVVDVYDHPFQTDRSGFPREMHRLNRRKFVIYLKKQDAIKDNYQHGDFNKMLQDLKKKFK